MWVLTPPVDIGESITAFDARGQTLIKRDFQPGRSRWPAPDVYFVWLRDRSLHNGAHNAFTTTGDIT
ncbi:MAG TPA: hypothetical protein DIW77_17725 [Chromatiaceae bacterium]|nr:MAG: hypothetical protein N838_20160 [Thiohalocapsa sp. PB-PSB1]HCS91827.1 hypothetical protein [Chromatiaceae bacterium]